MRVTIAEKAGGGGGGEAGGRKGIECPTADDSVLMPDCISSSWLTSDSDVQMMQRTMMLCLAQPTVFV